MKTEYKVVAYTCGERKTMAEALSGYSEEGWQHLDSWRYTGVHVEMVAFLLARMQPPKKLKFELEPERVKCPMCVGYGDVPKWSLGVNPGRCEPV